MREALARESSDSDGLATRALRLLDEYVRIEQAAVLS